MDDQFLCCGSAVSMAIPLAICFQRKSLFKNPVFVGSMCTRGINRLKTFSTVWEQWFTEAKYVWLDW